MRSVDDFDAEIRHAVDLAYPIFQQHGWTWGSDDRAHTPSHSEMYRFLKEIVGHALRSGAGECSSGRFYVSVPRMGDSDDAIYISLELAYS